MWRPMTDIAIVPADTFLAGGRRIEIDQLAHAAQSEGIGNVRVAIDQWINGEQKFTHPGESLLVATQTDRVIAIGGLTVCPTVLGAFRVRRFYVHPQWRRQGIAARLATQLLSAAPPGVPITCNAGASAAAPPFWETLGFIPVDRPGITHIRQPNSPAR